MGAEAVESPLWAEPHIRQGVEPVSIVIFGATGDLTARKLVPALFSLAQEDMLPPGFGIVGFARRPWSHEDFRQKMRDGVEAFSRHPPDEQSVWEGFAANLFYVRGGFTEGERYAVLDRFLREQAEAEGRPDNRLYYLAAPPQFYAEIIAHLGRARMARDSEAGWRRIVIEKPFGYDLKTATELNEIVHLVFGEEQIYRIDHYLGKETVQNILVLRFANAIFEPIWNRRYVDHVQISVAESVGIGGRAGYYDQAGVIRDIFQNHILQLLTLVAMEPPVAFEADAVRDEKVKVLRAMRPMSHHEIETHTVRAQYAAGVVNGEHVPGYCEEPNVAPDSQTATYAALKWYVDNWRWHGVPFYLRSGKRMATRATEVSIHFKRPPHLLFDAMDDEELRANVLALRIQPDEGIALRFEAKLPGQGMARRSVTMDFSYRESFGATSSPDAYERLLLDAMRGDPTLFARSDEIEWAWRLIDPIFEGWQSEYAPPLETYEAGTWGPRGADELLERDGRRWRRLLDG
ncbi:MAG TPA: glucose-6-phosphate dehydrogenase [Chloroflexi bacterium]|nr:glucose-6-phosphate dehydrogenase [Chloroflexota bacterium]